MTIFNNIKISFSMDNIYNKKQIRSNSVEKKSIKINKCTNNNINEDSLLSYSISPSLKSPIKDKERTSYIENININKDYDYNNEEENENIKIIKKNKVVISNKFKIKFSFLNLLFNFIE